MPGASTREPAISSESPSGPRRWTLRQRVVLAMIVWAGYWFIRLLGPTLRVSVSYEPGAQKTLAERPLVASFWHLSWIIPATYIFRDMGIRVMSSYSYDGEYMGRIIKRFGFVAVKGSSSRNPIRALLGLLAALDEGWTVAFTLDGPRGPRHRVKPVPVGLGKFPACRSRVPRGCREGVGLEQLGPHDDPPAFFARARPRGQTHSSSARRQRGRTGACTPPNCKRPWIGYASLPRRMSARWEPTSFP